MHSGNDLLWRTKLAARIHDPAEKALVLLRDPAGHEGGSIVGIGKELGFQTDPVVPRDGSQVEKLKLDKEMQRVVERADRWAAAADRAQFPKDEKERFVSWAQVRFADQGEIVNPLSGERYPVRNIGQDILAAHIRTVSEDLFKDLIQRDSNGKVDLRLTSMAFWRFGPELGRELEGIGHLWSLLPADTRTPDHSIWQHLDLVSALAGAMADGARPALLSVSMGPVQNFIAASRSTSDLWAGSHFLSALAWQGMRVIAAEYGPDAILFPQLRGVPIVDLWLIEEGLDAGLFDKAPWNDTSTDYNPLFVAALPNRFVAVVPEQGGADLARRIRDSIRDWVQQEGRARLDRLLEEIDELPADQHCYRQLEEQLRDFPEVHWSLAPWLPQTEMEPALKPFYPVGTITPPGLFGTEAWKLLREPIEPEQGWRFWEPNDGTLYPAVHDLVERTLAAAKSGRVFPQLTQKGYRDSLTGEYEWLTLEEELLEQGSPRQRTDTLWARVARVHRAWVKADEDGGKAEHLSAFGLIKRLWPDRFVDTTKKSRWYNRLKDKPDLSRYVVSTHVMALAASLERLMRQGPPENEEARQVFSELEKEVEHLSRPALPRRLMRRELRQSQWWETATRLPALVDHEKESAGEGEEENRTEQVLSRIEKALGSGVERYYALLLMDGDRLGAWLSGEFTLQYKQVFHTRVEKGLSSYRDQRLARYLETQRPVSPSRHMAISSALNGFALDLVRYVLEEEYLGKVLYAGGDDVMAMLSVRDLLPAMALLRAVYSGGLPSDRAMPIGGTKLELKRGFVRWQGRLYQVMGEKATASAGAVIAHYQAPLSAVLRELRAAERRAKNDGGRDAFSISVIKRSGGALGLTAKWGKPLEVLLMLRDFLAHEDVSRRAVYNTLEWLTDLPDPKGAPDMLASLMAYQFDRQIEPKKKRQVLEQHDVPRLAKRLAELTTSQEEDALTWLRNFLSVAEFLARETRTPVLQPGATAGQGAGG